MKPEKSIRVVLVDDHGMVRQGIRSYLEDHPHIAVTGEASDGPEALAKIGALHPDVVLLDINLPTTSGFATLEKIHQRWPSVNVIMVTVHKSSEYVYRALRSGAKGYILKEASPGELLAAIESANNGHIFVSPSLGGALAKENATRVARKSVKKDLSIREIEVLKEIANGKTSKEIARDFGISVRTVQTHRERMMRKLGIRSVAGLTRHALTNLQP